MIAEQNPSGIVTPEAVVLEFETAGVGSRGVAKLLDLLAQLAALLALVFALGLAGGRILGDTLGVVIMVLGTFLIVVGYPALIEVIWHGKSLGKAALGIRVITREGAPIKFRHAAVRSLLGLIEVMALPFLAVISCASSRQNQRFGDMAGGTIVIRERKAAKQTGAVTFPPPPGMEPYVRSLDVAAISAEQYQVIRSFLMRVFELTPPARMALAIRLANPVAIALKHDPPPMVSPELFLACIACAYQLRHGGPAAAWAPGPGHYAGFSGYGAYGPASGGSPPAGPSYPGGAQYPGGAPHQYPGVQYQAPPQTGQYPGGQYPAGQFQAPPYPGQYPGGQYPGPPATGWQAPPGQPPPAQPPPAQPPADAGAAVADPWGSTPR